VNRSKYLPKVFSRFFLLLSILFLICACGRNKYQEAFYGAAKGDMVSASSRAQFAENEERPAAEFDSGSDGSSEVFPGEESAVQTRKLVKRAELRLRVEDPVATEKPLLDLLGKYNAWPASTGIYENSRSYSIRVPSPSYEAMLSELAGLGRLLRRTENTEDVTLRYYDLEGRLATKRELLKTYQSYLGKAKNIDEIMTVEKRIAELQQELDWTGTQMRNLMNSIDYSTIDLEIAGPASASSYSKPSLGERLRELFGSFGDVASQALVVLAGIIIYGIPGFLVLTLLFSLLFGRIGFLKKLWRFAMRKKEL